MGSELSKVRCWETDDLNEKKQETAGVALSVVIPVYNEEAVLTRLFERLYPVLDGLGIYYEVVFVDDGSRDRSVTLLRQQHKLRPDVTRVLLMRNNSGHHAAVMAGLDASQGKRLVTLDADLNSLPEEIPRLLAEMDRGHDYVGSICRREHNAKWWDRASNVMNRLRVRVTGIHLSDQDSILGAYDRELINAVLASGGSHIFVPALAYSYAANPTEIEVERRERAGRTSRHPFYKLTRLNLEVMTGFSLLPLKIFSLVGIGLSLASISFVIFLAIWHLLAGSEVEGVSTLFGILFFLTGVILFGVGLLGEYLGHIYEQIRCRPSYLIREHLHPESEASDSEV